MMNSNWKVLVTGSEGFLGRYLVDALDTAGYHVYRFDRREPSDKKELTSFTFGDIRDKEVVDRAVAGMDAVVHAAAALAQFQQDEKIMCEINVGGTENILAASLRHGLKKFIFISSVEVYGPPPVLPCPEDVPLEPICEYGRNKVAGEKLVFSYRRQGLKTVVFRPPTIAGPGQNEPFLLDQFRAVAGGKRVIIPGSGRVRLQMVDARDVAEAVCLTLKNSGVDGEVFNLGSKNVPTLRETIEALYRRTGQEPRLLCLPEGPVRVIINLWAKFGTPPINPQHLELAFKDSIFNIEKAVRILGWEPIRTDLESNLETLDWYIAEIKNPGR
ncbi:MAG: NAD(P)-dependent oxidoreductase [Bacillota bacterium]|nr:NAD(P)-dependent oxidoreductase [Bacillota bacterium]